METQLKAVKIAVNIFAVHKVVWFLNNFQALILLKFDAKHLILDNLLSWSWFLSTFLLFFFMDENVYKDNHKHFHCFMFLFSNLCFLMMFLVFEIRKNLESKKDLVTNILSWFEIYLIVTFIPHIRLQQFLHNLITSSAMN